MPHRSKYQQLPTEAINPATLGIDKASSADIIELMLNDDRKVLAAVQREKPRIAIGVDIIVESLRKAGRVIFVGAGTSGRLGVVESAEMPTTFGTNPDSIQAVMAGGKDAFLHTKEGAEDSYEDGARAITRLKPTKKDVVIGVSASGMTPYVRGGLTRARKAGSKIIFVTCDPRTELQTFVDVTIAPAVGPEVIAGSTRLKAGTATKLVLNMLTTAAMVRIGKTVRQPDGRSPHELGKGARSRAAHHLDGDGARRRPGRQAAAEGPMEREGRHRDAENEGWLHAGHCAPAESARLGSRGDRRRHRAAPARAAPSRSAGDNS